MQYSGKIEYSSEAKNGLCLTTTKIKIKHAHFDQNNGTTSTLSEAKPYSYRVNSKNV
jgi:riboflavin synthase alpha subunit